MGLHSCPAHYCYRIDVTRVVSWTMLVSGWYVFVGMSLASHAWGIGSARIRWLKHLLGGRYCSRKLRIVVSVDVIHSIHLLVGRQGM